MFSLHFHVSINRIECFLVLCVSSRFVYTHSLTFTWYQRLPDLFSRKCVNLKAFHRLKCSGNLIKLPSIRLHFPNFDINFGWFVLLGSRIFLISILKWYAPPSTLRNREKIIQIIDNLSSFAFRSLRKCLWFSHIKILSWFEYRLNKTRHTYILSKAYP